MTTFSQFGPDHKQDPLEVKSLSFSKPFLNIEFNLVTTHRPHHYIIWSVVALLIGLSAAYGAIHTVNLAFNHGGTIEVAENGSGSEQAEGSNDATSSIDEVALAGSYSILNPSKGLVLNSKDYLVGDVVTGDIILEKNGTTKSPMASVTKLMTAIVDLETINQLSYATVTPASTRYYPLMGDLVMNEVMKVSDLKYPLLVVSSNVAAEVLANFAGRSEFLKALNDKAASLGMIDTHYDDPSGLSPQSYSTPEDLFRLARYVKKEYPEIFDIGRIREYSILGHNWINQNHQLTYSSFAGGKNGFTDQAQKTTVSLFDLSFNPQNKNDRRTVAVVLLKTNDREGDVSKILKYLSTNVHYEKKQLDTGTTGPTPAGNNPDQ